MGKRIELDFVYRPSPKSTKRRPDESGVEVGRRVAASAESGGNDRQLQSTTKMVDVSGPQRTQPSIDQTATTSSKPGRKPKIEIPANVREWMDAHGMRAVPKVKPK